MTVTASSGAVHVVAAVIRDTRNRVLLARRTEGRDLAGLWEFPGGKVEPGEAPEAALQRELHEELGIDVDVGEALINVPQRYPSKRLQLDVRRVERWRGTPRGREGQALAWVPMASLPRYDMPPADRPVVAALLQPDRLLVTPAPGDDDSVWLAGLDRAFDAGIRRAQLRAPQVAAARWETLAAHAAARARSAGVEVAVNGDITLALRLGTGLHLRASQLMSLAQRPVGVDVVLSASCHDARELQHAQALGCDFALLGPVQPTASHPGAPVLGWEGFAALREQCSLPIYALGGLDASDLPQARASGAQGVAAIRGFWPVG